jgi:serine phosphatase RsbU (regulator of sigma subunit)
LLESGGPALGLLSDGEFLPASGVLRSGDSMLLYTDGLVETPGRDFRLGIDKLLGEAERLMSSGWDDSALRLLDRLESSHDDRAILLLHRR